MKKRTGKLAWIFMSDAERSQLEGGGMVGLIIRGEDGYYMLCEEQSDIHAPEGTPNTWKPIAQSLGSIEL